MTVAPPAARLPRHLAVIMDGNGRWAQRRNRPRTLGHRAGAKAVQTAIGLARHLQWLNLGPDRAEMIAIEADPTDWSA